MPGGAKLSAEMFDAFASPPGPQGWIYDFQTLITGLLALAAAFIAAWIARGQLRAQREQIKDAREQAARDRAGRLRAARASLPAVLSAICDYSERTARALNAAWPVEARLYPEDANPLQAYCITVNIEPFPAETLQSLERVVELIRRELVQSAGARDRLQRVRHRALVAGPQRIRKAERLRVRIG